MENASAFESAFEIALVIPIALFCFIFVLCAFVCFISDSIEFFKKLCGRSFKEKVEERLSEIEQNLSDLKIEIECNSDFSEVLREHVFELDDKLEQFNQCFITDYFEEG